MQCQHRQHRDDDPTPARGPWLPPEFGPPPRGDNTRWAPPETSRIRLTIALVKIPAGWRGGHCVLDLVRPKALKKRPRAPLLALIGPVGGRVRDRHRRRSHLPPGRPSGTVLALDLLHLGLGVAARGAARL